MLCDLLSEDPLCLCFPCNVEPEVSTLTLQPQRSPGTICLSTLVPNRALGMVLIHTPLTRGDQHLQLSLTQTIFCTLPYNTLSAHR